MGKLEDMALLVAVAEAGGLSAAGRRLSLSPATMTARLKAIQERYQTRLFHRSTRSITLTRAGEELARDLGIEVGDEVICIKKRILADTTPVIYSIDYLPRALFGSRDYTRIDLSGGVFDILEQECNQQISSNVAHLKASCGDEAIRAAMRLAPGEAMLLLDEICYNRLCHPVMRSLSYYTNFFDFSILRKLL